MKKYELIQDYPGSPKLGSISNKLGQLQVLKKGKLVIDGSKRLKQSEIQYLKDKRYWKEVVEKDYEIMSFKDNLLNKIIYMKNGKNKNFPIYTEEIYLNHNKFWSIYSVKRLSDGEVFTVGDKLKYNGNSPNPIKTIKEFYLKDNMLLFNWEEDSYQSGFKFWLLEKYNHIKKPLFTTEDGVDLFEGDKFVSLTRDKLLFFDINATAGTDTLKFNPECFYFSTKEATEEYILMNKPCLSINDVLSSYDILGKECRKLKKIVKSKL